MKLQQIPQYKFTTKKFRSLYKYKVVFKSIKSSWFRKNAFKSLTRKIESLYDDANTLFLKKVIDCLKPMDNYHIRVESPYVAFYTDNQEDAEKFLDIVVPFLKYVQYPKPGTEEILDEGLSITKNMTYKYRVTMGRTTKSYPEFISWIEKMGKIGNGAKWELNNARGSWGGYYFYVKDDKSLTMTKLMVGNTIRRIETLTKN